MIKLRSITHNLISYRRFSTHLPFLFIFPSDATQFEFWREHFISLPIVDVNDGTTHKPKPTKANDDDFFARTTKNKKKEKISPRLVVLWVDVGRSDVNVFTKTFRCLLSSHSSSSSLLLLWVIPMVVVVVGFSPASRTDFVIFFCFGRSLCTFTHGLMMTMISMMSVVKFPTIYFFTSLETINLFARCVRSECLSLEFRECSKAMDAGSVLLFFM